MVEGPVPSATDRLAAELRDLRDMSGKSLRELEKCTHTSDSSLSRYLSGQSLPPWPVVEALADLAGRDTAPLRTLWSAAKHARNRRPETVTTSDDPLPAPPAPATPGRRRWRTPVAALVGVLAGAAIQPTAGLIAGTGAGAATGGPYFTVDLYTSPPGSTRQIMWSDTARCGSADEYRLTYDLPAPAQRRATAYRVEHADCTVKLFDGLSGTDYGEILTTDNAIHDLSPRMIAKAVSVVAYSCCNGTLLD